MGEQRKNGVKSALVVLGALGCAWLTIELAFKPFLDQLRGSMKKSDPDHDPDGDGDGEAGGVSSVPATSSEDLAKPLSSEE